MAPKRGFIKEIGKKVCSFLFQVQVSSKIWWDSSPRLLSPRHCWTFYNQSTNQSIHQEIINQSTRPFAPPNQSIITIPQIKNYNQDDSTFKKSTPGGEEKRILWLALGRIFPFHWLCTLYLMWKGQRWLNK